MPASPQQIGPQDATPSDSVTRLRELVVAIGNKVLDETAARQRLALEVQRLHSEISQVRAAVRAVSRR
jgi:hypothetical protein